MGDTTTADLAKASKQADRLVASPGGLAET